LGLLSGFGICFKENWEGVLAQTGEFAVSIAPFTRITKYTQLQNIVIQYFFVILQPQKTKVLQKTRKAFALRLFFLLGTITFKKLFKKTT